MLDHQRFNTRKAAKAEIENMQGWIARPVKMTLPVPHPMGGTAEYWVIECKETRHEESRYLREDGYVR